MYRIILNLLLQVHCKDSIYGTLNSPVVISVAKHVYTCRHYRAAVL